MRHVFAFALLCTLFTSTGWAASPQSIEAHQKIHPSLSDKFAAKGDLDKVRVIVSLSKTQPKGLSKAQAIAEAQGRVIGAFKNENNGSGLKVLHQYRTLYGFSAEINRGQATALTKRGDVLFIEEMPEHRKLHTESFPLTDVNLVQGAGYNGSGAVIAIIDDGIDLSHPAFNGKYLDGYDIADDDADPRNDCPSQSHGTAVAGVALGRYVDDLYIDDETPNGSVLGVAPGADLVFLKIQSASICGQPSLDGDIVAAIDWVVARKTLDPDPIEIDIISMSLGGGSYSSSSSCDSASSMYFNAVENANNAGITVIAASGNDGLCDAISHPACMSNVISVGATYDLFLPDIGWCISRSSCVRGRRNPGCPAGTVAYFEDAEPDNVIVYSNSASFLDITAPATCARSAVPGDKATDCFGGTSSATPFTSGTAALIVQAAGKGILSPIEMRQILVDNGEDVLDPKNNRVTPRVNAELAIAAIGGTEPPANDPPVASFDYKCAGLTCTFSDTSTDDNGVTSWTWDFGGDGSSTAQNPTHKFSSAETYDVMLTVTDNDQASDSSSQTVTVTAPDPGNVTLVTDSFSVRNNWTATVEWSDGSSLSGTWSTDVTCTEKPVCELSGIAKKVGSVSFTADNNDSVTITKP